MEKLRMERLTETERKRIWDYTGETVTKERIRDYLDVAARFPLMPWYNVLLILRQRPDAEALCGIRAWKRQGTVLRQGEEAVRILCPGEDDMGLFIGMVEVYDISQVKFPMGIPDVSVPDGVKGDVLSGSLEDILRGSCGLVILEDRDGGFLRSKAVRSSVNMEEKTVYIRAGLDVGTKNRELMKCYARYVVEKNRNSGTVDPERRDMQGDYLTYLLCRYVRMSEVPLRIIPGGLFRETAEKKGFFLEELSALFFRSVEELSGKRMLNFQETMFCNLFLAEPERAAVLKNVEKASDFLWEKGELFGAELKAFRRDMADGGRFSDGEIKRLYRKRMARELFTFPPVILEGSE